MGSTSSWSESGPLFLLKNCRIHTLTTINTSSEPQDQSRFVNYMRSVMLLQKYDSVRASLCGSLAVQCLLCVSGAVSLWAKPLSASPYTLCQAILRCDTSHIQW